ncbi:MAG: hypothetical protein U9R05_11360 [Chloroflexota bacterium]|nr:hypothetical protein [Chloroflexota bacterium]
MNQTTTWLLEGPPWVQYRARLDLLGEPEDAPEVLAARQAMLAHPKIRQLLAELVEWPGELMKNHKSAGHPLHKLTFIADLGLRASDPAVAPIVARILERQSPEGPFQVLLNLPPRYGGSGEDQWAWMLCDAPALLYALCQFGLRDEAQTAIVYLANLIRANGWPCAVSPTLKFRGPGRKSDPCPYANLVMLKALSPMPVWRDSEAAHTGAETLLTLWEQRRERRPYLFAMGSGFTKLKAPLIWYDILHVLDVLTRFPWLRDDSRLRELAGIVAAKADEQGRFTAESVWRAWKDWGFGQKKTPSHWLTLLARRALQRLSETHLVEE